MVKQLNLQRLFRLSAALALVMASPLAHASELHSEREQTLPSGGEQPLKTHGAETGVKPGLAGSFLSGRFARQNQDLGEAAKYLRETLARDPNNEPLKQETMRMQLLAGDVAGATELAHQLEKTAGDEPLVASLLMLERVKANDYAGAKTAVEAASGAGLFGLIRPVLTEWIDVAAKTTRKPHDLKAAIDKSGFFAPFINYHIALMNDVTGNNSAADQAFTKASTDPSTTPYRLVEAMVSYYQRHGKPAQAQAVLDAYFKANPDSSLAADRKLLMSNAAKPLVADGREGIAEVFFTTASILLGEDATQDTFLYLRIAMDLRPDLPPAQLMLASLYEQVEDYKQAIATYDAIPEGSVFYRRAQVRKALNYEALGQRDKALALLDALSSRFPNDATALITKGDMQRDAKLYDEAAETYSIAITRTEPLKAADWPLLYARGISYERAGEWELGEADFKRALVLEPSQPDVLNYLAYSWLMMNKNLEQAREYLETASAQRPDDAHIIDSVGWAYYLSGDYATAVDRFEHAIELMPDDPTVNDHLGDAYWRVGRETEARYQWERALTFKPDKEMVESLRNKLANGLPPKPEAALTKTASPSPKASAYIPSLSETATQVQ